MDDRLFSILHAARDSLIISEYSDSFYYQFICDINDGIILPPPNGYETNKVEIQVIMRKFKKHQDIYNCHVDYFDERGLNFLVSETDDNEYCLIYLDKHSRITRILNACYNACEITDPPTITNRIYKLPIDATFLRLMF